MAANGMATDAVEKRLSNVRCRGSGRDIFVVKVMKPTLPFTAGSGYDGTDPSHHVL